jgi:hypothetical protein
MPPADLLNEPDGGIRPEQRPGQSRQTSVQDYGAVAIGRNEGERLMRCLASLNPTAVGVYVDSGSIDGSIDVANEYGVEVVKLDTAIPFTAARARNAGFAKLLNNNASLRYVQFIDGDCEMAPDWTRVAATFLEHHPEVAAVFGRLRERHPERSIYNWLCDNEWDGLPGDVRACAGNVMIRVQALRDVGGYREDFIAGEESELCVRLRRRGWKIWRLPEPMALHDAAMTHFHQWWKRAVRSGYAFAQGADLHGAPPEQHFVWESRRAWIWGIGLPASCVLASVVAPPMGWMSFAIFPLQFLRLTLRGSAPLRDRAVLSFFQLLGRFPEAIGQLRFLRDRLLRRQARLIEHKS